MFTQFRCTNERRRAEVRTRQVGGLFVLNGIDHLEVASDDQTTLKVHFIHPLPGQTDAVPVAPAPALTRDNVVIGGGVRVTDVRVESVVASNRVLTVTVDHPGDFSTYVLRLIASPTALTPPVGFDPPLAEVAFSFKVDCPSEFDCETTPPGAESAWPAPLIDYMARDYASFRRLMLDRLAVVMPDWQERNPADLGVVLVELLAHAADQLSYYQDAVATEAYLGTARRRISVRRHARLLDYPMHDGCNARAWVQLDVGDEASGVTLRQDGNGASGRTRFLTRCVDDPVVREALWEEILATHQPEVFEPLHDITLYRAHNEIRFHTWSDEECCLPAGATRATLRDDPAPHRRLRLRGGDGRIFEEKRGPANGLEADANPTYRHAVRLTRVQPEATRVVTADGEVREPAPAVADPLTDEPIVEIEWHVRDALPFPLCISTVANGVVFDDVGVARGNVVLVDHGRTIAGESLAPVAANRLYRPVLRLGPVTQQGAVRDVDDRLSLFDPRAPASAATRWEMRDVRPAVELREAGNESQPWRPQRDLLASGRFATEFVVEMENDNRAELRFGDGVTGRRPVGDLTATYRIGNGRAGNVGADAIAHVVTSLRGVTPRNPLPAVGGTEPEPIEQVRLHAPQAFRMQERAVTEADYAAAAERHPEVQKAAATRRWTGSWYTMFVTVDRRHGRPVDDAFAAEIDRFLERFRLAGYDLEIDGPRFVSLDIVLKVCVAPGYVRANVKQVLRDSFSVVRPDGRRGFFHPDNFTFGQSVYLSQIVATAMQVSGVSWVEVERFRRWGEADHGELAAGRLRLDRLEIARLDNDPNARENGRIEFIMEGGL